MLITEIDFAFFLFLKTKQVVGALNENDLNNLNLILGALDFRDTSVTHFRRIYSSAVSTISAGCPDASIPDKARCIQYSGFCASK